MKDTRDPETNSEFTPENGWLEYDRFLLERPIFSGYVSLREGIPASHIPKPSAGNLSAAFKKQLARVKKSSLKGGTHDSVNCKQELDAGLSWCFTIFSIHPPKTAHNVHLKMGTPEMPEIPCGNRIIFRLHICIIHQHPDVYSVPNLVVLKIESAGWQVKHVLQGQKSIIIHPSQTPLTQASRQRRPRAYDIHIPWRLSC